MVLGEGDTKGQKERNICMAVDVGESIWGWGSPPPSLPDGWTLKKVCLKLQTTKKESLVWFWCKSSERQVNTAEMDIRWVLQRMQNIQGCLEEAWMRGVKDLLMEESGECIRNWRNVREQAPNEKGIMMDDLWQLTYHKRAQQHTQQPGETATDRARAGTTMKRRQKGRSLSAPPPTSTPICPILTFDFCRKSLITATRESFFTDKIKVN